MATKKKRTTRAASSQRGRGTSSSKKKTNNKRKQTSVSKEMQFEKELMLWVLLALSVLLFISNFGVGGKIGSLASSFLFGLFGLMAYIFPILLFVGTCFVISNRKNHFAIFKFSASILLFLSFCMFLQLIIQDYNMTTKGMISYAYEYSSVKKIGGGAIGGCLVWLCVPNFGLLGSYIIDILAMIISLILITERSLFRGLGRGGKKVYESARQDAKRYHENQQNRSIQRKAKEEQRAKRKAELEEQRRRELEEQQVGLRRMDRVVEGVAIDTTVAGSKQTGKEEMKELHYEEPLVTADEAVMPEILSVEEVIKEEPLKERSNDIFENNESILPEISMPELDFPKQEEPQITIPEIELPTIDLSPLEETLQKQTESLFESALPNAEVTETKNIEPDYDNPDVLEDLLNDVKQYMDEPDLTSDAPEVLEEPVHLESQEKATKNTAQENEVIAQQMDAAMQQTQTRAYQFPPVSLLKEGSKKTVGDSREHLLETANKLQQTLKNFGVNVTVTNVSSGPAVTRFEIQPEMGVKVSKIVNLTDDIKLNLAAADIRMEAPIPGKAAIGIEIPNKETVPVMFRELIESEEFETSQSKLAFAAGKDIGGKVIVTDIAKMPHLLIAGATGSGKSVCINTIIMSILYKAHPDDVKLIMVDPKVVELSVYNGIPHLMIPVVTDPKKAAGALNWAVAEMTDRYNKFAEYGVRDLKGYNAKVAQIEEIEDENKPQKMPQIVIIVDELADLMMVASNEVETAICRLAQLARAAGIHLIIATQRPSVNVITGLIKANMPSRVAFAVTSGVDSRTILDMNGAEKLLGKGDMLFFPQNYQKPLRVQGAFVSDQEVSNVVDFLKNENGFAVYSNDVQQKMEQTQNISAAISDTGSSNEKDVLFVEVGKFLIENEKGSIGSIQRKFKVGFNRAARIMDQLEEAGLVGAEEGTKPRKILMSQEQFEQYVEEYY